MPGIGDMIQITTHTDRPITAGGITVTPQSLALIIALPFGGFVWNQPIAVLVERDGEIKRIPVVDVTRLALMGMAGLGVAFAIAAFAASAPRNKKE